MKQRGFVLVATLFILAAIAVAATYFAERITSALALAQQYDQHIKDRIACSDSHAEIIYLLASRPLSPYGLGDRATHLTLDNQAYRMEGNCVARLQDARGLYFINGATRESISPLLRQKGIPENNHDQLYDTLMDYIDPNPDLRRLNGVTLQDYAAAHLPAPAGRFLITPDELRRVYGWQAQPELWTGDEPITDWLTTARIVGLNPNTAPASVLLTLPGMTQAGVNQVLQYRAIQPIRDETELANLANLDPQKLLFKIFILPANALRISIGAPGQDTSIRYNLTLTPTADEAPWRVDYYYHVPQRITHISNDALPSNPFELKTPPASAAPILPFFAEPNQ